MFRNGLVEAVTMYKGTKRRSLNGTGCRRLIFVIASTAMVCGLNWHSHLHGESSTNKVDSAKGVLLIIDYSDGVEKRFTRITWREGFTVGDLLTIADEHTRGIELEKRGFKDTAFVVSIDRLSNEGGGGRNWLYEVNGKLGDRSYEVMPVGPNDTVLWQFRRLH